MVVLLTGRERIWAVAFGPADHGPVEFATLERPRPTSFPSARPACVPPRPTRRAHLPVPEQALRDAIIVNWAAMARTRLVAGTPNASDEIRFVQYSKCLGFPDTISVATCQR